MVNIKMVKSAALIPKCQYKLSKPPSVKQRVDSGFNWPSVLASGALTLHHLFLAIKPLLTGALFEREKLLMILRANAA